MKTPPEKAWLIVAVISIIAAGVSAVIAVLSFIESNTIDMILSVIAVAIFVVCSVFALMIRSRVIEINETPEYIQCLKLKKPGLERYQQEEIVPKGKMPEK